MTARPLIDPDSAVVAYCAPGLKDYAARLLECKGEVVREIAEHPWLAGRTDIILAADPIFPDPIFPDPGPVQTDRDEAPRPRMPGSTRG